MKTFWAFLAGIFVDRPGLQRIDGSDTGKPVSFVCATTRFPFVGLVTGHWLSRDHRLFYDIVVPDIQTTFMVPADMCIAWGDPIPREQQVGVFDDSASARWSRLAK